MNVARAQDRHPRTWRKTSGPPVRGAGLQSCDPRFTLAVSAWAISAAGRSRRPWAQSTARRCDRPVRCRRCRRPTPCRRHVCPGCPGHSGTGERSNTATRPPAPTRAHRPHQPGRDARSPRQRGGQCCPRGHNKPCVWAVRCAGHPAPGRPIAGVASTGPGRPGQCFLSSAVPVVRLTVHMSRAPKRHHRADTDHRARRLHLVVSPRRWPFPEPSRNRVRPAARRETDLEIPLGVSVRHAARTHISQARARTLGVLDGKAHRVWLHRSDERSR